LRRRSGALAVSAAAVLLGGCLYRFTGGGLPNIKTVAVLPFDNQTAEPVLTKEVNDAITDAVEGRLGLRAAAQSTADALVRGRVVHYEANVPIAFQPGVGRAEVTQRQVQLTVDVEIIDQHTGKPLWQRQGLLVVGEYAPPDEVGGRKVALQKLENEIVDGAQSQW
jgi:Lipopolysaccharide-assembly